MAEHTNPNYNVEGVGVPDAQVGLKENMHNQSYQHFQQHLQQQQPQHDLAQQQVHQQQSLEAPPVPQHQQHLTASGAGVPSQPSFISQPKDSTTARQQYVQDSTPVYHSTEDAPNFHVGGLGAGAQVGELGTVQHASASRPPVGPFDPPAESIATDPTAPPTIFIQREATMRHDHETPVTTTTTELFPQKVHVASTDAVAAAAAVQAADAASRGRRRSSLAVLADRIRSATRSRSRSPSLSNRLTRTISRHSCDDDEDDPVGGPYRDVKIAQQEHLAKLRAEQEKNGITHNVDGLPIPPTPERQRRRSSVSHILGLDKPLLSR
ncbi:hypothetical protein BGZ96_010021 [Linnemannia gamsii]|uniref:Uncharacterized protein n=1 Tax=Linnemannia gamsii TaxID=64522 RepID=A0ABQ7JVW6_9FUNG|nr:hypothetical protein BGZ96_010021 [Linnemannia gamsii]